MPLPAKSELHMFTSKITGVGGGPGAGGVWWLFAPPKIYFKILMKNNRLDLE